MMTICAGCHGRGYVARSLLAFRKDPPRVVFRYVDTCVRCAGTGTEPSTPVIGT